MGHGVAADVDQATCAQSADLVGGHRAAILADLAAMMHRSGKTLHDGLSLGAAHRLELFMKISVGSLAASRRAKFPPAFTPVDPKRQPLRSSVALQQDVLQFLPPE